MTWYSRLCVAGLLSSVGVVGSVASATPRSFAGSTTPFTVAFSHDSNSVASPGRTPVRVEPEAFRLLTEVGTTLHKATSLRARTRTEWFRYPLSEIPTGLYEPGADNTPQKGVETSELRYLRPNYVSKTVVAEAAPGAKERVSQTTCTPEWVLSHTGSKVYHNKRKPAYLCYGEDDVFGGFFDPRSEFLTYQSSWDATGKTMSAMLRSLTLMGKETWNGVSYDVVEAVYGTAYQQPQDTLVVTRRIYISPEHTIMRYVQTDNKGNRTDHQVLSLELSMPMTTSEFSAPPPDTSKVKGSAASSTPSAIGKTFSKLDTPAKFLDGRTMTLRQALAGKKGALLWYWAAMCGSCINEFPHLEQMYRVLRERGVEMIALDPLSVGPAEDLLEMANAERMRAFWNMTIPIVFSSEVTGGLLSNGVSYMIIDADGKIVDAEDIMDYRAMYRVFEKLAGPVGAGGASAP